MRPAATVTILALLATAPGPARGPDDLVRDGNAAARRGELDLAAGCYADAARLTTDPGLVAFNRGVVALRRGRPRDAELHFLAALDDRESPPTRRDAANYNLGLALLLRGGSAEVYRAAVSANERCLAASPDSATLAGDAAHNLELAKLLRREADLRERQTAPPPPETPTDQVARAGNEATQEPGAAPTPRSGTTAGATAGKPAQPAGVPRSTGQTTAGHGTLPVLPDAEEFPPLSPEDARALLRGHAARLVRNRAAGVEPVVGPERPNARDW